MGWFFVLKLHIVVNEKGEILNAKITTGNTHDKVPVKNFCFLFFVFCFFEIQSIYAVSSCQILGDPCGGDAKGRYEQRTEEEFKKYGDGKHKGCICRYSGTGKVILESGDKGYTVKPYILKKK